MKQTGIVGECKQPVAIKSPGIQLTHYAYLPAYAHMSYLFLLFQRHDLTKCFVMKHIVSEVCANTVEAARRRAETEKTERMAA